MGAVVVGGMCQIWADVRPRLVLLGLEHCRMLPVCGFGCDQMVGLCLCWAGLFGEGLGWCWGAFVLQGRFETVVGRVVVATLVGSCRGQV